MKVIRNVQELRTYRDVLAPTTSAGYVPTMGGLHEGHLSLIRLSSAQNRLTFVSLFVNPAQFALHEDLSTYPRPEAADLALCKSAGADVVFCPDADDVYPAAYGTTVFTAVGLPAANPRSEGASRPTFFQGVATVLTKLFCLFRPHRVYFGQKDAQQCAVVRQLVRDMWFDISIIVGPTIREPDGLAMSSRNCYLSDEERSLAPALYRALRAGQAAFKVGECDVEKLRKVVQSSLEGGISDSPNIRFELVYISICNAHTMREVEGKVVDGSTTLICAAAMLSKARLIDNITLDPAS